MSTKHLYDSADGLVLKSLRGAVALNPALRLHETSKSVYLTKHSTHKSVAVISGGGAGHEPAHAGYTGKGMLSASVSGDIFASPSSKQIQDTIQLAAFSDTGNPPRLRDVLVIINNYTGDRLNFGLAIEKSRNILPGLNLEAVVVADDVSLRQEEGNGLVGPRGLAGNILVCKALGALAERGETLNVVKSFGDAVVKNLRSLGVGLDHSHVPGRDKSTKGSLQENECEVGLGLHNEPGVKKQTLGGAALLIEQMIEMILGSKDNGNDEDNTTSFLHVSEDGIIDDTILFVNNLGGMSQLEMNALVHDILSVLSTKGIQPQRSYCSSYMTSLNAPGFSVSIINVSGIQRSLSESESTSIDITQLLDDPTDAMAWIGARSWTGGRDKEAYIYLEEELLTKLWSLSKSDHPSKTDPIPLSSPSALENAIKEACHRVLRVKEDLTQFDSIAGDGDCGETFAAGAKAVLVALENKSLYNRPLSLVIQELADVLTDSMGGTMGALFGIFFNALAASLQQGQSQLQASSWSTALQYSMQTLSMYTPANIGDRTVMDALQPFCTALQSGKDFSGAVKDAGDGAERTRGMEPRLGRAVYTRSTDVLPPDPGAWGVMAILQGLVDGYQAN